MKIPFISILLFSLFMTNAQEKNENTFNRWSVEVNAGQNKAIRPFLSGYFTSNPDKYFNINGVEHFDIGARYMFSTSFGLKLDFGYDVFKNNSNTSIYFKNEQKRIGLQGVINLGRIIQFETFTNRFGLLAHAGVQMSSLNPKSGINSGLSERDGGLILGISPQFRLTNSFIITADFSTLNNVRQHLNWDGSYSAKENNLSGLMYNTTIGLTVYLGKNEKHADWYLPITANLVQDEEARQRLSNIEKSLKDTDKDGIPDYLDEQPDTVMGVAVDSKGRFIDINKNGIPDEKEKVIPQKKELTADENLDSKWAFKNLMEYDFNIMYYESNRIDPNANSKKKMTLIIEYLKKYPDTKVHIIGFADNIGSLKSNKILAERRAKKLQTIIESYGIDPSRLRSDGNGVDEKFNTTANNPDPIARRVSIILE